LVYFALASKKSFATDVWINEIKPVII